MIQLHLSECHLPQSFDPVALARRNDPSTSQQAAERVGEFGGAHTPPSLPRYERMVPMA